MIAIDEKNIKDKMGELMHFWVWGDYKQF